MTPELESLRALALRVAEGGASIAFKGFRSNQAIQRKGVIDLVTEFDLAAEAFVREELQRERPEDRVVGEEGGADGEFDPRKGKVWFVDPIDGTTNFAHGHPFFCCSVGLYEDGEPLAGAVVAPALGLSWSAVRGGGTLRNGQACRVSTTETLGDALCATGFPYDRWETDDDNTREFRAVLKRCRGMRRCGSAALDLCFVADGTYDAYWEQRLQPWDMGAGALMVLEAGGRLTDYDGGPADPLKGRLVASGGPLHDELLQVLG